jgi:hypothetical protein
MGTRMCTHALTLKLAHAHIHAVWSRTPLRVGAGGCSGGLVSKSTVPPIGGVIYRTRLGRMAVAFTPYRRWVRLTLHPVTAPSHPPGADALDGGLEDRRYSACGPRPLPGFRAPRWGVP